MRATTAATSPRSFARVGLHLLTVQFDIGTNQNYATAKPTAIELAKLFASRLR